MAKLRKRKPEDTYDQELEDDEYAAGPVVGYGIIRDKRPSQIHVRDYGQRTKDIRLYSGDGVGPSKKIINENIERKMEAHEDNETDSRVRRSDRANVKYPKPLALGQERTKDIDLPSNPVGPSEKLAKEFVEKMPKDKKTILKQKKNKK